MRDAGLHGVQAVIPWQQRHLPEGHVHRLYLDCQHCGMRIPGARPYIRGTAPASPLGNRFRVDPLPLGRNTQAVSTIFYGSADGRCRADAPAQTWPIAHPSIAARKNAQSNPDTKQLEGFEDRYDA